MVSFSGEAGRSRLCRYVGVLLLLFDVDVGSFRVVSSALSLLPAGYPRETREQAFVCGSSSRLPLPSNDQVEYIHAFSRESELEDENA